jgi:hypothetical protein
MISIIQNSESFLREKVILDFHTKDHPYMIHPRTYRLLFFKSDHRFGSIIKLGLILRPMRVFAIHFS